MSLRLFPADILFAQRLFACAGFYAGKLDGLWGPATDRAAAAWDAAFIEIRDGIAEFDGRSEMHLRTVLPGAQKLARMLLRLLIAEGIDARILSGTRTYVEQTVLYRQGRSTAGRIVTNARAGQSNHNFGLAWDVGVFEGGQYLDGNTAAELEAYDRAGHLSSAIEGLEWGGNWRKKDRPHYQAATGLTLAEIRARFEVGGRILPDPLV